MSQLSLAYYLVEGLLITFPDELHPSDFLSTPTALSRQRSEKYLHIQV